MTKAKRIVYRVLRKGDGWDITKDSKPVHLPTISLLDPKTVYVKHARKLARREWANGRPSQLVIHGRTGAIQTEYTYGNDPKRSPG